MNQRFWQPQKLISHGASNARYTVSILSDIEIIFFFVPDLKLMTINVSSLQVFPMSVPH